MDGKKTNNYWKNLYLNISMDGKKTNYLKDLYAILQ
jgi:hypothetical protein